MILFPVVFFLIFHFLNDYSQVRRLETREERAFFTIIALLTHRNKNVKKLLNHRLWTIVLFNYVYWNSWANYFGKIETTKGITSCPGIQGPSETALLFKYATKYQPTLIVMSVIYFDSYRIHIYTYR